MSLTAAWSGFFNKYKVKGSFHLNAGTLGVGNNIQASEVAELFRGHEISCHSFTHPFLERISKTEVAREMLDDRLALEAIAGYPAMKRSGMPRILRFMTMPPH